MGAELQWAIITPSYNLDAERCQLLCRSMDTFLSGPWHHYIIVDPVDLPLFRPLAGPRREILDKREILPKGTRFLGKLPFMRLGRMWWSWKHGPIFGWQMQQIVKISMASVVKQDAMMFLDSDTFFLRPFNVTTLARDDKVRAGWTALEERWREAAVANSIKLMGLSIEDVSKLSLTEGIMTWHRPTVLAMQTHLEKLHGKPWQEAIGSKLMFSEYNLYDLFRIYVQTENPALYEDFTEYSKTLSSKEKARSTDLDKFCQNLSPPQVAVRIQSLIGIEAEQLENQFNKAVAAWT